MQPAGSIDLVSRTAHVLEETRDACDGVDFLTSTRPNWENSAFGNHLAWHLTLRYFGKYSELGMHMGDKLGIYMGDTIPQ